MLQSHVIEIDGAFVGAAIRLDAGDRPAAIKADVSLGLPYPRRRGDPRLSDLRREILSLDANW
jgi:NitT/TauT family transport system ATP-binding protein